jgi:hypothetical protein
MIITLTRDYRDNQCTLGVMAVNGYKWQTLERPWVPSPDNVCGAKGISCVPAGEYRLTGHNSEAHPKVWALVNAKLGVYHWDSDVPPGCVLARTVVLIHAANYPEELRGCIAVGKERKKNGRWWIAQSRDALNEVRNAVSASYDLQLTITESPTCQPPSGQGV